MLSAEDQYLAQQKPVEIALDELQAIQIQDEVRQGIEEALYADILEQQYQHSE